MKTAADRSLHALADENIPFAREALATVVGRPRGSVERVPGRPLQPADAARADVLWVRSVTPVGPALLGEAQRLQFVGSATAGTDHVDRAFLRERGIAFAHAPGSNAFSVADYVVAALLAVAARHEDPLRGKTAAVVGCGAVGSRVARRLEALGLRVLRNDPPLAEVAEREGRSHDFRRLEAVLAAADVVTLHTPLTREGPHPGFHLMDDDALATMPPGAWLVNTARGAVVQPQVLGAALEAAGHVGAAVLDVWPGEPTLDPALAALADVATPHIAGYAFDGKVRGTEMLYRALCEYLGVAPRWYAEDVLAAGDDTFQLNAPDPSLSETAWLDALTRQMYDVRADDRRLRAALEKPAGERGAAFTSLRREYPRRRAFSRYRLAGDRVPPARREAVEDGLGIRVT